MDLRGFPMDVEKHYAEIQKEKGKFSAVFGSKSIAEADEVLVLQEFHPEFEFPAVYYFPEDSLSLVFFEANRHHTSCPIKGIASYWDLRIDDLHLQNAVWSYPEPLPSFSSIKAHYAFDTSRGIQILRNGDALEFKAILRK